MRGLGVDFLLLRARCPQCSLGILWRRSERKDVAQHGFFGEGQPEASRRDSLHSPCMFRGGLAEVDALREDSVLIPDRLIVAENGERGCMKAEHRERCYCASS